MNYWRRAGVWLGLVEDDDERLYDDEFDDTFALPERARPMVRATQRSEASGSNAARSERGADRAEPVRGERDRDFGRADRTAPDRPARERDPRERDLRLDDQDERLARVRDLRTERELRSVRDADRAGPEDRLVDFRLPDPRSEPSRIETPRADRGSVRSVPRPTVGSTALSEAAPEALANAPQVQLRERAAVSDERSARRYEITMLHPTSYSEARAIGEHFRDGNPVIMNLTDMAEADAKRLVDFAAGLAFGLRGGIERVTNRVFLLTPPNIRVSDEEKQRMAETGFFDRT